MSPAVVVPFPRVYRQMEFWDRVFTQDLAEGKWEERVVLSWNENPCLRKEGDIVLIVTYTCRLCPNCSGLLARHQEARWRTKSELRVCHRRGVAA
jgi:hypothetical protein